MTTITTKIPFASVAIGEVFATVSSPELFVKHSAWTLIDESGERIRVSDPARALVLPVVITENPRTEAARLGSTARRYLRAHNRRPYGDRGVEFIVRTARAALRAAHIAQAVRA